MPVQSCKCRAVTCYADRRCEHEGIRDVMAIAIEQFIVAMDDWQQGIRFVMDGGKRTCFIGPSLIQVSPRSPTEKLTLLARILILKSIRSL
jgi:hypothetical protein